MLLELFFVVRVPFKLVPVAPVVEEEAAKLKQYKSPDVKSSLAKVTVLSETFVAVAPIPGHGVEPCGRLAVLVVQSFVSEETVKLPGKVTAIFASFPAPGAEACAQTVPESGEEALWLLSLKYAFAKPEALISTGL